MPTEWSPWRSDCRPGDQPGGCPCHPGRHSLLSSSLVASGSARELLVRSVRGYRAMAPWVGGGRARSGATFTCSGSRALARCSSCRGAVRVRLLALCQSESVQCGATSTTLWLVDGVHAWSRPLAAARVVAGRTLRGDRSDRLSVGIRVSARPFFTPACGRRMTPRLSERQRLVEHGWEHRMWKYASATHPVGCHFLGQAHLVTVTSSAARLGIADAGRLRCCLRSGFIAPS